jgi:hypothetical protein
MKDTGRPTEVRVTASRGQFLVISRNILTAFALPEAFPP